MGELVEFKSQDKESEWREDPAKVVPIDYRTNPDWSEAHQCFIDQLPKLTDEEYHNMEVQGACYVLRRRIEDESPHSGDIEQLVSGEIEQLVRDIYELDETDPHVMIGRAYVALIDEREDRTKWMRFIKPVRNGMPEGRLAHYVLLLDAERHGDEREERVTSALRDHGTDMIILEACARVAYGNEFLEKLVEKYS